MHINFSELANIPIPDRISYLARELVNHFYEEISVFIFSKDDIFIDYLTPVINNVITKKIEIFKEAPKKVHSPDSGKSEMCEKMSSIKSEICEKVNDLFIFILDIEDVDLCRELIKGSFFSNLENVIMVAFIGAHKRFEQWKLFDVGFSEVILKPFPLIEFLARFYNILKTLYYKKNAKKLALEDSLTGLYNRRYFDIVLEEEVHKAYRNHSNLSIILIDIDSFKSYNDTFGHKVGDEILALVGTFLRSNIRRGVDKAFRIGGDEFAVIVPENLETAVNIANRLAMKWEEVSRGEINLSIGVSELEKNLEPNQACQKLFKEADKALYKSKAFKGNYVSFLTQEDKLT